MITVKCKCDADAASVTATGHAGYAAHGQDIVCAAVSTLMGALEYNLRLQYGDGGYVLEAAEGYMHVAVEQPDEHALDVFAAIINGMCMLAEQYGAYVEIEVQ